MRIPNSTKEKLGRLGDRSLQTGVVLGQRLTSEALTKAAGLVGHAASVSQRLRDPGPVSLAAQRLDDLARRVGLPLPAALSRAVPAAAPAAAPAAPAASPAPPAAGIRLAPTTPDEALPEAPAHDDLPLPDFDHLTIGSLRARLARLDENDLELLLAYEREHANRLPIVTMLENRLAKVRRDTLPGAASVS